MVGKPEEIRRLVADAQAEYRLSLPMRLAEMESLWQTAAAGEAPGAKLEKLSRLAHAIAGSAGTFGLTAVSAAARALELALTLPGRDDEAKPARDVDHIESLLEALKRSANMG